MKHTIIATILIAVTCAIYARDESYTPNGFIGQSVNLLDDDIAIVSCEVSKWNGPEKPVEVKVLGVLHGAKAILKVTKIFDDEFDPIFREKFKPGSKWILRIKPRSVDGQKQWVVSYYQTAHLHLIGDHVTGSILKHNVEKKMKYSHFKTLLMREIEKKRTNNHGAGGGK